MDCGNLTDPTNGQVTHTSGTTFGQTATYSCNTGYKLVENNTRTCQTTGVWSGSAPTCQGVLLKVLFTCVYKKINNAMHCEIFEVHNFREFVTN